MVAGRFWNFIKGLFWQGQRSLEQANPEAVYEMAIQKMKGNYQEMRNAVGKLAAERNRLRLLVGKKEQQLATVEQDLEAALSAAQAGDGKASEIGEELRLSVKTVSTYRTRLLEKMGMSTNSELTRYAIQNGLV